MPGISDATVLSHSDNVSRILSNKLVGMIAAIRVELQRYDDTIKPLMSAHAAADLLLDGSGPDGDGRVPQSKGDQNKFWIVAGNILDAADGKAVAEYGVKAIDDIGHPHTKVAYPLQG